MTHESKKHDASEDVYGYSKVEEGSINHNASERRNRKQETQNARTGLDRKQMRFKISERRGNTTVNKQAVTQNRWKRCDDKPMTEQGADTGLEFKINK